MNAEGERGSTFSSTTQCAAVRNFVEETSVPPQAATPPPPTSISR
jgi:hypothetical protein